MFLYEFFGKKQIKGRIVGPRACFVSIALDFRPTSASVGRTAHERHLFA